MISLNDGSGPSAFNADRLRVVEAACRIFLGTDDRDITTIAAEVGCEVELLLAHCERLSEERAALKRAQGDAA
jgi:hypothetical protein